jgi:DNA polymerase-3 subunit epsilon
MTTSAFFVSPQTYISHLPNVCIYDLETTGTDVFEDRVVTAYAGRIDRAGVVRGSYSWLLNPGVPIAPAAAAIHGISDEVAERDGQDAATGIASILEVLARSVAVGRPIMAYNASFDLSMINAEARRYGLEPIDFANAIVLDPLVIDKGIDKYRKGSRKLIDTAKHYGVELTEDAAHDAEQDAIATGRVGWKILERTPNQTLQSLHDQQIEWAATQILGLEAFFHRSGKLAKHEHLDPRWPVRNEPLPVEEPPVDESLTELSPANESLAGPSTEAPVGEPTFA